MKRSARTACVSLALAQLLMNAEAGLAQQDSLPVAAKRLPGGGTARAGGDIASAWYGRPTGRYRHGVLGDAIEGGSLFVTARDGKVHELVLPKSHVFEDLTPRIADLDGDGRSEVLTIRSSLTKGAALAIYGLVGGELSERAATREIGTAHRWLSVAGIGRYLRGAGLLVAFVETPHLGGTLRFARFARGSLSVTTPAVGKVSNHRIGSTLLSMSATADIAGGGTVALALPSADRRSLVVVSNGKSRDYPVPGRIDGPIRFTAGTFLLRDESGHEMRVDP